MDSQDYAYDSDESDEGYGDDGGFESVLVRQRTQAEWQVCVPRAMELRGRLREHFSDHPLELRARLPEHFSDHPLSPPSLISDPLQRPPSHTRLLQVLDSTRCLSLAEAEVGAISELLCCPTDLAALLLRYFKWDREKLTNDYMADAQAVLESVGVLGEGVADRKLICLPCGERVAVGESTVSVDSLPPIVCQICFESTRRYSALSCGHRFCSACYTTYVGHQISDEGHACVWAKCPAEGCKLTLTKELVLSLPLPEETLALYENATRVERSYVDDNPLMRWCTAAGCTKAIQAPKGQLGVTCTCGERFCFSCGEADHRPCSCENLAQWIVKCRDDSETFNWLVSHTKACPKCHTAIEKNGGCNHMTCKKGSCKHEFCWVCLGPWKDHSGSYYSCNKYDASKETAEGGTKKVLLHFSTQTTDSSHMSRTPVPQISEFHSKKGKNLSPTPFLPYVAHPFSPYLRISFFEGFVARGARAVPPLLHAIHQPSQLAQVGREGGDGHGGQDQGHGAARRQY